VTRGRLRRLFTRPVVGVGLAITLVLLLRAPFAGRMAFPDEGGLLLVAQHAREGGPELYGRLFVDRPPGLMAFFITGEHLGGLEGVRWLAIAAIVVAVLTAARIGWVLGGRSASVATALTAAALLCNPLLGTRGVNAELVGAPLTLLCCLAAITAVRRTRPSSQRALLVLAGVLGSGSLLVKQNLVDGLAFGAALIVMLGWTRAWSARHTVSSLAFAALGAALPWLLTLGWAATEGPGVRVLWDSLYGFRGEAAAVISGQDASAPTWRLLTLPFLGLASGLLLILVLGLWSLRTRVRHRDPVVVAALAMTAAEVAGVLAGGSYWAHYLVGLLPGAVLTMALMVDGARGRARVLAATVGVAVASSLVASAVAVIPQSPGDRGDEEALTTWLSAAAVPGDTGVVTWGHPQVLEAAGLRPRSSLIWSLPQRTLDPHLDRFVQMLSGRRAPTWVVVWDDIDTWGLDDSGRAKTALTAHFDYVTTLCEIDVWVRSDIVRVIPPLPTRCVA
jgi:4-amino-4-deoxy-L-arabinose transferase-like glycosyltransferase